MPTIRIDVLKESAFETAADWSVSHGTRFRANIMKSTKVQTLGGNIGTFGLETPICMHMY